MSGLVLREMFLINDSSHLLNKLVKSVEICIMYLALKTVHIVYLNMYPNFVKFA